MTHLENWSMGLLVTAVLLVASALLDGPDDLQAEADAAAALADAQAQAQREAEAQLRCADLRERGNAHLWDVAAGLHCLDPRHRLVAMGL